MFDWIQQRRRPSECWDVVGPGRRSVRHKISSKFLPCSGRPGRAGHSPFDITQPGTLDDPNARVVGRMVRGVAPSADDTNRIDAALADIGPNVNTNAEILGIGAITGTKMAAAEMTVEKFGRNSGYRAGYVFNIYFDISVPVPGGEARFVDQIAILGLNGLFAGEGDSGSLVLERESNRAVGLLFVQAGTYSLANHISAVLSGLDVNLVS